MPVEVTEGSGNVFEDIGFSPEEAANLRLRSELMIGIARLIEDRGLSQRNAARLLGVTQPRVSDLVRGKIHRFSVESLLVMLHRAGVRASVSTETQPALDLGASAALTQRATSCVTQGVEVALTDSTAFDGEAGDTEGQAGRAVAPYLGAAVFTAGRFLFATGQATDFGMARMAARAA
jgi:predicted XRE-type DNA-binding protein